MSDAAAWAGAIADGFARWHGEFRGVTRRARGRFARREWRAAMQDAADRLALHGRHVDRLLADLAAFGAPAAAPWPAIRDAYMARTDHWPDAELARTFFNSVTRRLLGTVGVDPRSEFTGDEPPPSGRALLPTFGSIPTDRFDPALAGRLLAEAPLGVPFADLDRDAHLVAGAVAAQGAATGLVGVDILPAVFYRNKGAYLVARLRGARGVRPLVLALVHEEGGAVVDAVLTDPGDASAVFGFTRSYFHADVEHPAAVVDFLAGIMPVKRPDELWTAIGYHKHGKTELYRTLMRHLAEPGARFTASEGDRGMVMAVFTLPSLNVVFKVIKDRFDPPKSTTREQVMEKYNLVFRHDRVGRLADAQEFDHLELRAAHFEPALLEELALTAARTVTVEGDRVVVGHVYAERRVVPLNLYLRQATPEQAAQVIVDYGTAVRDLAAANIFPGDMLLKNFGVTRHGRVIFYDYDELCLLTECRIRRLPPPPSDDDELSAEVWFAVREGDVFPEEFRHFLTLPGPLGEVFLRHHAELFEPAFWEAMQARQRAGEVIDFFPYPADRRLPGREGGARYA